jgi:hypothetical protein
MSLPASLCHVSYSALNAALAVFERRHVAVTLPAGQLHLVSLTPARAGRRPRSAPWYSDGHFEFEIVPERVAQNRTRGKLNGAGYPAARQAPSPCICRGISGMRGRERNTVVDRRALIVGRCGQAGELMLLGPDLESILRARMSKPLFKQYRPQPELLNRAGDTADYTSVDDPTVSRPNRLLEISYQRLPQPRPPPKRPPPRTSVTMNKRTTAPIVALMIAATIPTPR